MCFECEVWSLSQICRVEAGLKCVLFWSIQNTFRSRWILDGHNHFFVKENLKEFSEIAEKWLILSRATFKMAHIWDQLQGCRNFQYLPFFGSRVRNKKEVKYISWRKKLNAMNPLNVSCTHFTFFSHPLLWAWRYAWSAAIFPTNQKCPFVDHIAVAVEGLKSNFFSNPLRCQKNVLGKTSFWGKIKFLTHIGRHPETPKVANIANLRHFQVWLSQSLRRYQKCSGA